MNWPHVLNILCALAGIGYIIATKFKIKQMEDDIQKLTSEKYEQRQEVRSLESTNRMLRHSLTIAQQPKPCAACEAVRQSSIIRDNQRKQRPYTSSYKKAKENKQSHSNHHDDTSDLVLRNAVLASAVIATASEVVDCHSSVSSYESSTTSSYDSGSSDCSSSCSCD